MNCHKIRTEQGAWNKLETYISKHSNAKFSHGICPDCLKKEMGELDEENWYKNCYIDSHELIIKIRHIHYEPEKIKPELGMQNPSLAFCVSS